MSDSPLFMASLQAIVIICNYLYLFLSSQMYKLSIDIMFSVISLAV